MIDADALQYAAMHDKFLGCHVLRIPHGKLRFCMTGQRAFSCLCNTVSRAMPDKHDKLAFFQTQTFLHLISNLGKQPTPTEQYDLGMERTLDGGKMDPRKYSKEVSQQEQQQEGEKITTTSTTERGQGKMSIEGRNKSRTNYSSFSVDPTTAEGCVNYSRFNNTATEQQPLISHVNNNKSAFVHPSAPPKGGLPPPANCNKPRGDSLSHGATLHDQAQLPGTTNIVNQHNIKRDQHRGAISRTASGLGGGGSTSTRSHSAMEVSESKLTKSKNV